MTAISYCDLAISLYYFKWVTQNFQASSAKKKYRNSTPASNKLIKITQATSTPTKFSMSRSSIKTLSSNESSPSSIKIKMEKYPSASSSPVPINSSRFGLALRNRRIAQNSFCIQNLRYWRGWLHNKWRTFHRFEDDGGKQPHWPPTAATGRPYNHKGGSGRNIFIKDYDGKISY